MWEETLFPTCGVSGGAGRPGLEARRALPRGVSHGKRRQKVRPGPGVSLWGSAYPRVPRGGAGRGGAGPGERPARLEEEVVEGPESGRSLAGKWTHLGVREGPPPPGSRPPVSGWGPGATACKALRGHGARTPRRIGIGRNGFSWMQSARALGFYPPWSARPWGPGWPVLALRAWGRVFPGGQTMAYGNGTVSWELLVASSPCDIGITPTRLFGGLHLLQKNVLVTLGSVGIWTFTHSGWVVLAPVFVRWDIKIFSKSLMTRSDFRNTLQQFFQKRYTLPF